MSTRSALDAIEGWLGRLTRHLPRPLDPVRSIKAKLSILIVAAVGVTAGTSLLAFGLDLKPRYGFLMAAVAGLVMVQLLARGMTSPLRDMVRAANALARGRRAERISASSRDEVGELARAFNAMADDLAELERQRKDLIANVSHELRTPLAALRGHLENLVDGVRAPDEASFAVMLRQTERLERLVEQLLDLSRLEAGQAPMAWGPVDIAGLLARVADEARLQAPACPLALDAPEGLSAEGDVERLHQVLTNLVDNALRYSPAGEPVTLVARADAGVVTIEVADRGPGLPAGESERLFERFHRAQGDRSRQTGGAGLGLAIARWIVELHGGQIQAHANTPTGCRMVISIPERRVAA